MEARTPPGSLPAQKHEVGTDAADDTVGSALARAFEVAPGINLLLAADPPRYTMLAASDERLAATLTTRAATLGRPLFEVFSDQHPENTEPSGVTNLRASLETVFRTRAPHQMAVQRYDLQRPDGTWEIRHWAPRNIPVLGPDGAVRYILHHVEDVTESIRVAQRYDRLHGEYAESQGARLALEEANTQLQDQALELELTNQQLQESAVELELQAEELKATAVQLGERSEEAERTARALRASEQQLRTLADTIPTLAWMAREDGYVEWYNARWYAYTGTTPADMEGWGWQRVHDPNMLPNVLEEWTRSLATGEPFEMIFPLRSATGEFRRFLTRVAPLHDASGRLVRWFGVNTDVEEQRAARAALTTVLEAVTDGFVAVDEALRYTYVNTRAAEMWGLPAESLLGRTPSEVWPELDLEGSPILAVFRRVMETRQMETLEAYAPTLGTWIETRTYPAAGGGIAVFFADVSERRRSRERALVLAEASELLTASTEYTETLTNVARAMVPRLADWSAVDLLDDPASEAWPPIMHRVAIVHEDPVKVALGSELMEQYPERWDDPAGMTAVIREGQSMYLPDIPDDLLVAGARDPEHLGLLRLLQFHSILVVPILARGRVLGALTLCMTESARRYTEADLALAEDLGRRAGVAIDTVRLLQHAREARTAAEVAAARTTRLQHVTALLAGALTEREVADTVIREGAPAFGASDGVIYLVSDDGEQLELTASLGMPEATTDEYRVFPRSAPLPVADVIRTGEPIVLETRDEVIARYPMLAPANARAATASWIALPLRAGEVTLGGMVLGFEHERRFSDEDRTFADTLARLCAQALLRAQLYDAAETARAAAQEANAVKLAFLATMSHELRTPLNAIGGHVQIMEMGLLGPVSAEQLEALARVDRAQSHLLGLINDILTYAKVDSGRVEYLLVPVDPAALLRRDCLLVEPQFSAKGITLRVDVFDDAARGGFLVLADPDRVSQVCFNLLSNALKFTPTEGVVTVSLARSATNPEFAEIRVRDTGIGLAPEAYQSVFEPFVQLGRGLTTSHEGTGLGLSISRELARGMGGDLTVGSSLGQGAEFVLTLPCVK